MAGDVTNVQSTDSGCPSRLRAALEAIGSPRASIRGRMGILEARLLAFLCSVKCPGDLIIQTYDLARALRDAGIAVAGGFQRLAPSFPLSPSNDS